MVKSVFNQSPTEQLLEGYSAPQISMPSIEPVRQPEPRQATQGGQQNTIDPERSFSQPQGARAAPQVPAAFVPLFEQSSVRHGVPINLIMGVIEQESGYNPNAIGPQTQWGRARGLGQYLDSTARGLGINPFDPAQAIDAVARQIRERLDKGYTPIEAVREHFAGPNRNLWGPKTARYGEEVMARAYRIAGELGNRYDAPAEAEAPDEAVSAPPPAAEPQNAGVGRAFLDAGTRFGALSNRAIASGIEWVGQAYQALGDYTTTPVLQYLFGTDQRPERITRSAETMFRAIAKVGEDSVAGINRQAAEDTMPSGDLFRPSTWSLGRNPSVRGYLMLGADVLGSMLPVVAASALTGGSATVGALVGGAIGGGGAAEQAREVIDRMASTTVRGRGGEPISLLEQESAYYRELLQQGKSEAEALAITRQAAERYALILTTPVSAAGGALTAKIVNPAERIVSGGNRAARAVGRAAIGAVEEGSQEAAESIATNQGINTGAGTNESLTDGTFGDFVLGALGGGTVGGVAGALSRRHRAERAAPPASQGEAQRGLPAPDAPSGDGFTVGQRPADAQRAAGMEQAQKEAVAAEKSMEDARRRIGETTDPAARRAAAEEFRAAKRARDEAAARLEQLRGMPGSAPPAAGAPAGDLAPAAPPAPSGPLQRAVAGQSATTEAQGERVRVEVQSEEGKPPVIINGTVEYTEPAGVMVRTEDGERILVSQEEISAGTARVVREQVEETPAAETEAAIALPEEAAPVIEGQAEEVAPEATAEPVADQPEQATPVVSPPAEETADKPAAPRQERAPAKPKGDLSDIGGMAAGMGESLRAQLWDAAQKGETRMSGVPERILQAAKAARERGGVQSRAQFDAFREDWAKSRPRTAAEVEAVVARHVPPAPKPPRARQAASEGNTEADRYEAKWRAAQAEALAASNRAQSDYYTQPGANTERVNAAQSEAQKRSDEAFAKLGEVVSFPDGSTYDGPKRRGAPVDLNPPEPPKGKAARRPAEAPAQPQRGSTTEAAPAADAAAARWDAADAGQRREWARGAGLSPAVASKPFAEVAERGRALLREEMGQPEPVAPKPARGKSGYETADLPRLFKGAVDAVRRMRQDDTMGAVDHGDQQIRAARMFSDLLTNEAGQPDADGSRAKAIADAEDRLNRIYNAAQDRREAAGGEKVPRRKVKDQKADPAPVNAEQQASSEQAPPSAEARSEQPQQEPGPTGGANTIFTEDAAAKAREVLRAKLNRLNSGIDPEILQAGITLAGYHIERGARTFAAYAQAMLADLGETARPYLKSWYLGVKFDPRAAGFDGMDSAAAVEAASLDADGGAPAPRTATVSTPNGMKIEVAYEVRDMAGLVISNRDDGRVNPDYPQELQPRDRTRPASEAQVARYAASLDLDKLGESKSTADGAPIVSKEGVVESGNGRSMAIRRAYEQGNDSARSYRAWIEGQGFDTAGMKAPVLVRVRQTEMTLPQLLEYTQDSNERNTLALSASERAAADARDMGPVIGEYRGGDVTAAANRDFVRRFMQAVVTPADQASMIDANGFLSQDGRRRIEAAMLHAAYGDDGLVNELFESGDSDIKAIGGALLDVSGIWAQMRSEAASGTIPSGLDVTPQLIEAVNTVRRARQAGRSVAEFVGQDDFFGGSLNPMTVGFLSIFYRGDEYKRPRGRDKIADALDYFAQEARKAQPGPSLFGDAEVSGADLLGNTNARINQREASASAEGQASLFGGLALHAQDAGEVVPDGQRSEAGGAGEARQGGLTDAAVPAADLEQDRTDGAAGPVLAEGDGGTGAGESLFDGGRAGREAYARPEGDPGAPIGGPALDGARGDLLLRRGDASRSPESIAPGGDFDGGSDLLGVVGISPDPIPAAVVEGSAVSVDARDEAGAAQRRAESVASAPGIENIRETLPALLPGQQDDVAKTEERFSKPNGYGMLLTNGTGTGKTYSGLGVVKRFARQGRGNILIVVPDDKVAADWVRSGRDLMLDIKQLDSTKDAGRGIVVTTYANLGQNAALASREWDLVVPDEAHNLMKSADATVTEALRNLRALTYHPEGAYQRTQMENQADYQRMEDLSEELRGLQDKGYSGRLAPAERERAADLHRQIDALKSQLDAKQRVMRERFERMQGEKRTRALFLSATPFAYEKNVEWAQGYLFDYPKSEKSGYNKGSGRDQFMMQHFGYRMRYNKLTEPGPEVDRGLMQRNFNTWLKREGALSSRMLDVQADYDRRFVLIDSAMGNRIDEALSYLRDQQKDAADAEKQAWRDLNGLIDEQFDYLSRMYLLEAIKAEASIPMVKAHLARGRKVVVFHDFKRGGGFNPFDISKDAFVGARTGEDGRAMTAVIEAFRRDFSDLVSADWSKLKSPVEQYRAAFGENGVLVVNGDQKARDNLSRYKDFQNDATGPQVILVQSAKNAGWSGHDTTGKHQRVLINLGLPVAPTTAIQQEGRIYRTGQVSDAIFRYLNTGTNWEKFAFASKIAQRASTAENLGMGEDARALKDSFISAFLASDAYPPGHEGEGKGGKAIDRAANTRPGPFAQARAFYYATQKKTAQTKSAEGTDYFATPEPLGQKMVQWADARGGDRALEPSAGHGAIARWFGDNLTKTFIEPSTDLRARLALSTNPATDKIVGGRFEDLHAVNKFDVIAMNPPFGSGGKTAIEHLAKAVDHLANGGRVVALIPTGPAADKRFDAWLYAEDAKGRSKLPDVHFVADVRLPPATFERAGTKVATRIVVLDRQSIPAQVARIGNTVTRDLSDAATINELFDRIENMDLPERQLPAVEGYQQPADAPRNTSPASAAPEAAATTSDGQALVEHVTQRGKLLRGVIRKDLTVTQAQAVDPYTFRKDGGFFIRQEHISKLPPVQSSGANPAAERQPVGAAPARAGDPSSTAFKRWFGASKVVDATGKPAVVYHGTMSYGQNPPIGAFNRRWSIEVVRRAPSMDAIGSWFSSRADHGGAGAYFSQQPDGSIPGNPNGQAVYPVYLRIEKPLTFTGKMVDGKWSDPFDQLVEVWDRWQDANPSKDEAINRDRERRKKNPRQPNVFGDPDTFIEAMKARGYDGVILRDFREGSAENPSQDAFIAFDPEQIKSATGNSGAYDPANPDIRASVGQDARPLGTAARLGEVLRAGEWGAAVGRLIDAGRVVLHDRADDMPGRVPFGAAALTMPDGTIHMAADRIGAATAPGVLLHEVLHGGARPLVGQPVWQETMGRMGALLAAAEARRADGVAGDGRAAWWDAALERVNAAGVEGDLRAEELAAYAVEHAEGAPPGVATAARRLVGSVKAWLLRRFGIQAGQVTPEELRALAIRALRDGITGDRDAVVFSVSDKDAEAAALAPDEGRIRRFVRDAIAKANPAALATIPLRPLLEEMGRAMPSAAAFLRVKQDMDAMRSRWFHTSAELAGKWGSYRAKNAAENRRLMSLMHDSTLAQVDPSKPFESGLTDRDRAILGGARASTVSREIAERKAAQETARREAYAGLKERYEALSDEGKALYSEVRDTYGRLADAFDKALLENIDKAIGVQLKQAERQDRIARERVQRDTRLSPEQRADRLAKLDEALAKARVTNRMKRGARMYELRKQFETSRLAGPYFPLARFGEFYATARDMDGKVVSYSMFERESDQRAFVKRMEAAGHQVQFGRTSQDQSARSQVDPRFVAEVEGLLEGANIPADLQDEIWQRYLRTLPDLSNRTSKIHRKGTAGFTEDALRAFAHHMFHGSHQVARLTYAMDLQNLAEDAIVEAKDSADPNANGAVANEMQQRLAFIMNPTGAAWAQSLSTFGYVYYLSVSPAAAALNLSQTTVLGIPILTAAQGKDGPGVAAVSAELGRALAAFTRGRGRAEQYAGLTPDEKRLMAEIYEIGLADTTQAHDLAGVAESGMEHSPARFKVMKGISFLFHHAERANREVTALAAYRLARRRGLEHAPAVEEANRLTWKVHFDYQNTSRPRVMQGNWAKVFLQFRNFTVNMLYRLFRDAHQTFRGETAEVRREARIQLIGISMALLAHAGMAGVWGYGLVMALLGMFGMGGDSEEPEDRLRKWMQDHFGTTMTAIMMDGVVGWATGTALTGRIGMGDLWLRSDDRNLEGKEAYWFYAGQFLGPLWGVGENLWRGGGLIAKGEVYRGIEVMMPKAARDLMRATRYGVEGARTLRGDPLMENVPPQDMVKQALGFTPASIAELNRLNNSAKNMEKAVDQRRQEVLEAYWNAYRRGEPTVEALRRADALLERFNDDWPERAVTGRNIVSSIRQRQRMSDQTQDGLRLNPRTEENIRGRLPAKAY